MVVSSRAGWTAGALAGSLVAGVAISALMLVKGQVTGQPSDLIAWERAGADRLGVDFGPPTAEPGAAEQVSTHAAHLALSALGGAAYAAIFDEEAPTVSSGLAFGMAFYVACHWIAGPLMRLKPPEWREPPLAVAQHLVVHAVYGLAIASAAKAGLRRAT